ncbi:MAG: hypothetical protein DA328_04325, partial [Nitrososphaeraceae archaeon]|nr:hypothetical protein [Nitrososphaeraceae archaeon]
AQLAHHFRRHAGRVAEQGAPDVGRGNRQAARRQRDDQARQPDQGKEQDQQQGAAAGRHRLGPLPPNPLPAGGGDGGSPLRGSGL